MAACSLARDMASSEALNELESEVTCPLCHGIFTEPKRLVCDHVYCRQCLHGLALRSTTGNISCPECRTDTPVPSSSGVTQLATPHQVNRLVEMYQRSLKRAKIAEETRPDTCKEHESQPLALYCETCESLVCRDCVINSCSKKMHKCDYVDSLMKKHEADFSKIMEPIKSLHQQISVAKETVLKNETELGKNEELKLKQIESTCDDIAELMAHERQYFTGSIKKSFKEQRMKITAAKKEVLEVLSKLDSVIESMKRSFLASPSSAILKMDREDHQDIEKQASNISMHPAVVPQLKVELTSPDQFLSQWQDSNFVYKLGDPFKGHLHSHSLELEVPINETSVYTFCIDPHAIVQEEQFSLKASLLCCRDGSSEVVSVKKITLEQYSLSLVPHTRGRHELHIMYNNTHICGSPVPVYVTIQPEQFKAAISTTEIEDSAVVRCYGGKMYVSSFYRGNISILDSLTRSVEKTIEVPGVQDVLVTQDHIFAGDVNCHKVLKMDKNGTVVKSVGRTGSNPGEFIFPNGIRQSKEKEIYVCDSFNNRIQIFDEDLNLIRIIGGEQGDGDGCFNIPNTLDFDEVGNIYVTDERNHRVQVLTAEGQHIRNIGSCGSEPGELQQPASAVVHKNMIYIADYANGRISVFKLTGEFVTTFGHGLSSPGSVDVDEDGYVHVSCHPGVITTF